MNSLNCEISSLITCAINPLDLIHTARVIGCLELITKAFPDMPVHMRYELFVGERELVMGELGDPEWWTTRMTVDPESLISEQASIEAAELVGPNSCEYDHLCEQIEVRMWDERLKAQP